ncbi:MAG: LysM peptidoglycan-binding domain-containing protein [Lachnospiraceae bacterium]
MTETVYEKKAAKEQANLVFRLPKNRKQIGQPGEAEPEIFVEDYAWVFGKRLAERDYTGCAAGVLLGEVIHMESGKKILIRGIMEVAGAYRNDNVEFTEDVWASVYRDIGTYFPEQEIVGWYLGGPGFLLEAEEKLKKVQIDHFGGADKLLLKMDSIEREEIFLSYRDGQLEPFPGYYIYYERNTEMQSYMISRGMLPSLAEEEELPAGTKKQQELHEAGGQGVLYRGRSSLYRLIYASGGMLACIAVLVIAGLVIQLKERNELRDLLNGQSYEDAVQANTGAAADTVPTPKPDVTIIPTEQESNAAETKNSPTLVPTQEVKPTTVPTKEPSVTPAPTVQVSTLQREYVVQKGDTLASICMHFYGTVEILPEIMRINGLEDRDKIYAGQVILLP